MIRLFLIATAIGLVLGVPGLVWRLATGHRAANYGSVVTWGLWVATYIYFIGLSAGSFLISSLVFVFDVKRFELIGRLAIMTALVTLVMALVAIGLDIGHVTRFWHVYVYPNFRSPMAWMIWLYTSYMVLLTGEAYFIMRRDCYDGRNAPGLRGLVNRLVSRGVRADEGAEGRARDLRKVKVLASIGVPLAVMFHGGVGALFGVLASRPMWHSGLYPVLFLLSAVVSGGAAITLLAWVFLHDHPALHETVRALGVVVLGVVIFESFWELAEIGTYMYGGMPSHVAPWKLVMAGPFPAVFWIGQVVFGSLLPIVLLTLGIRRRHSELIALGGLSIAVAFLTVRLNMVIPALSTEEIRGIASAYASPRWVTHYVPSLMEWLVVFFIVGLGGTLFTLGWQFLPLRVGHEHGGQTPGLATAPAGD
jgi:molybdopterin-containing oxidoreductase family membrane subunit